MSKKIPVYGDCALCKNYAELQDSHIVPKFIIRAAGLLKRKFNLICLSHKEQSDYNMQDGIKEPLLCWNCEQKLGKWEFYARQAIYGKGNPFTNIVEPGVIWTGLDYTRMKLFTTSILFRMSLSKHGFYAGVNLGDKHEANIRNMLLAANPGEVWQYGCILGFLFHGGKPIPGGGAFSQPHHYRFKGRLLYRFVLSNFVVFIDASSHPNTSDKNKMYLQLDGTWPVPVTEARAIPFIKHEIDTLHKNASLYSASKPPSKLNRESSQGKA